MAKKKPSQQPTTPTPLVGVIMGSTSDLRVMQFAAETLRTLGVPHEERVVSAHRTPKLLFEYSSTAHSRGLRVIIAGAGGAAHLPGMVAAMTPLPVLGVPVESSTLAGLDSLLSIVQMPAGVPVGTLAIGKAGAVNAALLAAKILAHDHPHIAAALEAFRTHHESAAVDPAAYRRAALEQATDAENSPDPLDTSRRKALLRLLEKSATSRRGK
jgi:5-(carboxyamino)imidazole ribonucleotide mutase